MKKIMIVDDNYLSAEGIEKNIDWETLNAEIIHVCYNGTSAIEAMKKEPADLIISDIEMPDLDGISMPMINLNMQDALCSSVLWIISKSLWIMPILSRR